MAKALLVWGQEDHDIDMKFDHLGASEISISPSKLRFSFRQQTCTWIDGSKGMYVSLGPATHSGYQLLSSQAERFGCQRLHPQLDRAGPVRPMCQPGSLSSVTCHQSSGKKGQCALPCLPSKMGPHSTKILSEISPLHFPLSDEFWLWQSRFLLIFSSPVPPHAVFNLSSLPKRMDGTMRLTYYIFSASIVSIYAVLGLLNALRGLGPCTELGSDTSRIVR